MSWDPRDYDGVTFETERRDRDEERELLAQEAEERTAREMAFIDTHFCELDCFERLEHTAGCREANELRIPAFSITINRRAA